MTTMTTPGWGAPSRTVYSPAEEPYGNVLYADPGYRDNKKRYPIDTEAHVRAALAYVNMPRNAAKYTSEQLEMIKERIHAAAKKYGIKVTDHYAETVENWPGMVQDDLALLAGAAPVAPPSAWFSNPNLAAPTRLTITPEGRVFGHLAQWRMCHVGIGNSCVMAPKSRTEYGLFKVGSVLCDDGSQIPVGKIVMGSAHANAQWGVMPSRDFYDNSSMTAAVVNIGEDQHGIWVSGALTSGMTDEKTASLRASALSGDWRTFNGNYELIAALAVNSPGFPIYRSEAGSMFSMQGVGIVGADELEGENPVTETSTEFAAAAVPTGIDEQAARQQRLAEIENSWEQHRKQDRMTQLAVLDETRNEFDEVYTPRSYNYQNSSVVRSEFNGPKLKYIDDFAQEVAEDVDDEVEEDVDVKAPVRRRIKVPKRRR